MKTYRPTTSNDAVLRRGDFIAPVLHEIRKVIVGQDYLVNRLLLGLLCNGHLLIEGVPGLAKTLAVKTLSDTIEASFNDVQAPVVHVDSPNGGEVVVIGTNAKLSWTATDNVGVTSVDLQLSRNNGTTQETIATGIANTGTFDWLVTPPGTNDAGSFYRALLTVTAHDGVNAGSDVSDAAFAIYDPTINAVLQVFQANPVDDAVELRWQIDDLGSLSAARLERADAATGPWTAVSAAVRIEGGITIAVDRSVTPGATYHYRLVATAPDGGIVMFGTVIGTAGVSIKELAVTSVVPNPSFASVRIEYTVPTQSQIHVSVVDIQGREVAVLNRGMLPPGVYHVVWNGQNSRGRAPAGMYFIQLKSPKQTVVRRMVLAR